MSGLSKEDRARLERWCADADTHDANMLLDCPALAADILKLLALIDQQEEALRAADDLYDEALFHAVPESQLAVFTRAYRSARPTSTKEDG